MIEIESVSSVRIDGRPPLDIVQLASVARDQAARDALLAALVAYEAGLAQARIDAEAKCQAIIDTLNDPVATKEDAVAEAAKTERQRLRDALEAERLRLEAEAAAKQAEIDALDAQPAVAPR